jgi:rRNA biogenesis protein RRP5
MRIGKTEQARMVLQQSLKALPKHEHVAAVTKFALLDFKNGEVERGRTLFENLLANYPKRIDLWSVYIDQELRVNDQPAIRALFERVTAMSLSSKKMKFFFKRYLEYEKTEGDETTVEHVMQRAREYIESKMQ